MTSKHYKWQTRWRQVAERGTLLHDTGIECRVAPDGRASTTLTQQEAEAVLAVKNGPHNAPAMLRRLLREAEQLEATQAPRP